MGFDRSLLSLLRRTLVAICLPALLLAACDQSPEERAEALLKTAQERLADGYLAAAVIDLKNVVQTDPQSAAGRRLLGEVYFRLDAFASAEKGISRARDRDRQRGVAGKQGY